MKANFPLRKLLLKYGHLFWYKIGSDFWKNLSFRWQVGIKLSGKVWLWEEKEPSFLSFFSEKAINTHYHLVWQKLAFPKTLTTVL